MASRGTILRFGFWRSFINRSCPASFLTHGEAHHLSSVMPALVAGIHVLQRCDIEDVDGRNKSGHDVATKCLPFFTMTMKRTASHSSCAALGSGFAGPSTSLVPPAGRSIPRSSCINNPSAGEGPHIHVFAALQQLKTWMAGTSPAMTVKNVIIQRNDTRSACLNFASHRRKVPFFRFCQSHRPARPSLPAQPSLSI